MEMQHVRYFLALCEEGNFTRAAERCGVAQSSITKAIQALEAELNTELFVRHRRRIELTENGSKVEPHFAAIERCVAEIRSTLRSGSSRHRRRNGKMPGSSKE